MSSENNIHAFIILLKWSLVCGMRNGGVGVRIGLLGMFHPFNFNTEMTFRTFHMNILEFAKGMLTTIFYPSEVHLLSDVLLLGEKWRGNQEPLHLPAGRQ